MTDRRSVIAGAAATLAASAARPVLAAMPASRDERPFVRRDASHLMIGRDRYRYAGANMWYAAYLGAEAPIGDRARLRRELDALTGMGIGNLRILASSEASPLRNAVKPSFRDQGTAYNETLLRGLDVALAEMGKRGMRAVLYLTNFWDWSGGMMTYLSWTNGGRYIEPNDPAHPWPAFADMTAQFYRSPAAIALYHEYVRAVVGRTNSVTGMRYIDDPTIMAWQLANEPRPGGSAEVAHAGLPPFLDWVRGTARLIKSIDPNHLVSTGSEGLQGGVDDPAIVLAEHAIPEIDYLTAHIWPLNWSWVDDKDLAGTWESGAAKVRDYVRRHVALANQLNKPLVIEEFGFPRDHGYDPGSPTVWKDRFYRLIYGMAEADVADGGPTAGTNFWAWGGSGRSATADHRYRPGPAHLVGDPPHEPQGWYSVFDVDVSTRCVIAAHASAMRRAGRAAA
ncbi:MAG: mannanase [Sphingomonas sp.]|uniref:glycoside hydrolase 5 family protein n=1 Tax=Sphingomonas sp. TaxID=28214 RepID=UPI001AC66975|nr:mannanase [Sphingomonas sp.]MBN8807832.1 mannanase [Sphingomonas sp.]